jgi:hypothetical protein
VWGPSLLAVFIRNYLGLILVGRASLALRRFAAPRLFFCFVLFLDKAAIIKVSMKIMILDGLKNKPKSTWSALHLSRFYALSV